MPESDRQTTELPPLIMTSEPGSFARHTIVERKPQIINRVMIDNDYPEGVVRALKAFQLEIAAQQICALGEQAPDTDFWNQQLSEYRGKTWLEIPWYLAECYFYRRLLEAVRYFQPGPLLGGDPFEGQKQAHQVASVAWLDKQWQQLDGTEPQPTFEALLHVCLWGNRFDLSNYTVGAQVGGGLALREEWDNILIDHTCAAWDLVASGLDQVHFINDNVGVDVLADLALADFLLTQGLAGQVVSCLKGYPFFVSDAMPKDVHSTVSLLRSASDARVQQLGKRLHSHLETGRLSLKEDPFWTTCLMFRHMPQALREELARSDLVVIKGDVNYRRLLGDRHWPHTTPMEGIAAYFPTPFLVLRTMKGEIAVGLEPGQAEALTALDPTWMVNAKRGIIQLVQRIGSGPISSSW